MKTNYDIIKRAIETARKIGRIETEKDIFKAQPTEYCVAPEGASKQEQERCDKINKQNEEKWKDKLREFEDNINSLGTELNTLCWLYEDEEKNNV